MGEREFFVVAIFLFNLFQVFSFFYFIFICFFTLDKKKVRREESEENIISKALKFIFFSITRQKHTHTHTRCVLRNLNFSIQNQIKSNNSPTLCVCVFTRMRSEVDDMCLYCNRKNSLCLYKITELPLFSK